MSTDTNLAKLRAIVRGEVDALSPKPFTTEVTIKPQRKRTSQQKPKLNANGMAKLRQPKTEEHKAKISASCKGRTSPNKGRTLSDEHKAKLSAAAKGHKTNVGRRHSEETKAKMAASMRAKHAERKAAALK